MSSAMSMLRAIVDEQAEDEGLWFVSASITEAYLQQALRRLHEAIETGAGVSVRVSNVDREGNPIDWEDTFRNGKRHD